MPHHRLRVLLVPLAMVLVHGDDSAARDNVGLLRQSIQEGISLQTGQPWAEYIEEVEVRSQGRVLLANFEGSARQTCGWISCLPETRCCSTGRF